MSILAAISIQHLLPVALFGLTAAVVFLLLQIIAVDKPRAEARLEVLSDQTRRQAKLLGATPKKTDKVAKVLEKSNFAKSLQPQKKEDQVKLRDKLNYAGFRSENAINILYMLKGVGAISGLVLGGGISLIVMGFVKQTLMTTIGVGGILFFLPDIFLMLIAKRRQEKIFLGLPDALDLMVVCVEAGLGLDQAMRKVSDEMQKLYPTISDELALCNLQLQMGRSRHEVLHELGSRTGVSDLRSLASILIQADKFGSSIAQALRVQSNSMRTRRAQMAEEKAAKTAVKLIFPLVLFIFPGIFVVLVGPAAITMVREMLPMLGSG